VEIRRILHGRRSYEFLLNEDDTITLQKVVDDSALEEFVGMVKTTKTTEEIMEELRGPRHENGC